MIPRITYGEHAVLEGDTLLVLGKRVKLVRRRPPKPGELEPFDRVPSTFVLIKPREREVCVYYNMEFICGDY